MITRLELVGAMRMTMMILVTERRSMITSLSTLMVGTLRTARDRCLGRMSRF